MHPKILYNKRIADMLRDEKRSEFWNESAKYQRFGHPVQDDREASVDVCREVRLQMLQKGSSVVKKRTKPRKKGSGIYKKRDYPWMTEKTKIEFTFKKNKTTATYAGNNKWTWDFDGNPQTDTISRFAGDWIRHLISTQRITKGGTSKNGWDVCNQPGHARGDWENYGNC